MVFRISMSTKQPRISRNRLLTAAAALIVILSAAILIALTVGRHQQSPTAAHTCPSPGCATVNLTRTLPPFTVFYGASCTGVHGSWFFNAVEGGGNNQLRPSYSLHFSLAGAANVAKPSGRVTIAPTDAAEARVTINEGTVTVEGTHKPNVQISATGSLVVQISSSSSPPVLTFTETGLVHTETALGLVSPFNVGGQPLIVPVKMVKTLSGC